MLDSFNIAVSGMTAANVRLNVAANNIANMESEDFTAARTRFVSLPEGQGVRAEVEPTDQPNDLAMDLVDLQAAHVMYTANAVVVRASDRMLGSLLDVLSPASDSAHRR